MLVTSKQDINIFTQTDRNNNEMKIQNIYAITSFYCFLSSYVPSLFTVYYHQSCHNVPSTSVIISSYNCRQHDMNWSLYAIWIQSGCIVGLCSCAHSKPKAWSVVMIPLSYGDGIQLIGLIWWNHELVVYYSAVLSTTNAKMHIVDGNGAHDIWMLKHQNILMTLWHVLWNQAPISPVCYRDWFH